MPWSPGRDLACSRLAIAFQLPVDQFDELHSSKHHDFRLLHYPDVDLCGLEEDQTRIAEHTDLGSLTLLFQDSTGGLEVEEKPGQGRFVPVHSEPPTTMIIIINTGDSFQRWTNGMVPSAYHRVTFEAQAKSSVAASTIPERYSIAFFGKPNRSVSLRPFPQLVSDSRPPKCQDVTAGEYNQLKLRRTY